MLASLVDVKDLPRRYGGDLEWDFLDNPMLDDPAKKVLGSMPRGPFIFEDGFVHRPAEYEGPPDLDTSLSTGAARLNDYEPRTKESAVKGDDIDPVKDDVMARLAEAVDEDIKVSRASAEGTAVNAGEALKPATFDKPEGKVEEGIASSSSTAGIQA